MISSLHVLESYAKVKIKIMGKITDVLYTHSKTADENYGKFYRNVNQMRR